MLSAVAFSAFGRELHEAMRLLPHISATIALSVDGLMQGDEGGTVQITGDGHLKLHYPVGPALQESFAASHEAMVKIHLAGGATEAGTLHNPSLRIRDPSQLGTLRTRPYGANHHAIFSAHQMGGCAMGADPERAPVDLQHRLRGVDNLFVVDGSVLPTALGVNPSQTIYGLARRAVPLVGEAV